jgi:cytochrome c oxidase subunit 2
MTPPGAAIAPPFETHSVEARAIADLFTQTLFVCGFILLVVTVLIAVCAVKFRERKPGAEPAQTHGHTRLEIAWTVVPILIVVWLTVLTARTMAASDPPADRTPDITVTAHQWWWEVRYRSGVVTANEIHVPAAKDVLISLESADVIHDFWVPQLGRKIDATPGHPTHVWIQADEAGSYLGTCAEYCGAQHAWMRIVVVAQPLAEFEAWERHQLEPPPSPASEDAARGAQTFREMTCAQCHAIGSGDTPSPAGRATAAPDLTHLAGRTTLGAGVVDNTPSNLALWLKDPQAIKEGSHMPSLKLKKHQVADLVSYLETLQ